MATLEDTVRSVVNNLVSNSTLFTALDVSNAVKATHPLARHREIRDLVRGLFFSDMQVKGYGKTPIQVQLADGSQVEALLYHHLSDSWDLDTKYDDQQRSKSALTPVAAVTTPTPAPVVTPAPAPTPSVTVTSNVPVAVKAPAVTVPDNTPITFTDPKKLWDNLFTGVKLFP
ncbi:unnamed protein product [Sphagnum jensenii]|uniref:Uncharacterized protein n=1 Tax=Sphagnum jensenii TaxID=128206 RepID=A0ABP0VCT8_9BRYO